MGTSLRGPALSVEHRVVSGRNALISAVRAHLAPSESGPAPRDLREDTGRLGGAPICEQMDRSQPSVCGAYGNLTLRSRVNVPTLVAEICDGSQRLNLILLGRRRIGGMRSGTCLSGGRMSLRPEVPTIVGPACEMRPGRGH